MLINRWPSRTVRLIIKGTVMGATALISSVVITDKGLAQEYKDAVIEKHVRVLNNPDTSIYSIRELQVKNTPKSSSSVDTPVGTAIEIEEFILGNSFGPYPKDPPPGPVLSREVREYFIDTPPVVCKLDLLPTIFPTIFKSKCRSRQNLNEQLNQPLSPALQPRSIPPSQTAPQNHNRTNRSEPELKHLLR